MEKKGIVDSYNKYYTKRTSLHVYPVEFVVRTFLGTYPNLKMDRTAYSGSKILDLGYGDGRNMSLLNNLGFNIYGLEISEEINKQAQERLAFLDIKAELKVGSNNSIPYAANFFDYILACHACYYINENTTFTDNLNEISRVLKPKGIFICSVPMADTYILKDAESLKDGHYRITSDPYGIRNGYIFRAFKDEKDIIDTLSPLFSEITIGFCDDNFYGIHQKVWIITATKK